MVTTRDVHWLNKVYGDYKGIPYSGLENVISINGDDDEESVENEILETRESDEETEEDYDDTITFPNPPPPIN